MEEFNLNLAIQAVTKKYDYRLIANSKNLQATIEFEYGVVIPIEELDKYFENREDYELEERKMIYDRN